MTEEIRKEVENQINKVDSKVTAFTQGMRKLAVKLVGMVISFWLILIAMGIGIGVPVGIGLKVFSERISKTADVFKKEVMGGDRSPKEEASKQTSPSVMREVYYVQSGVRYEEPKRLDKSVQEVGNVTTELRRMAQLFRRN